MLSLSYGVQNRGKHRETEEAAGSRPHKKCDVSRWERTCLSLFYSRRIFLLFLHSRHLFFGSASHSAPITLLPRSQALPVCVPVVVQSDRDGV